MGRIKSFPRRVKTNRGHRVSPGKILKLSFPGVKYQTVFLYKEGVAKAFTVHTLVLRTFVGESPAGTEACHWNGEHQDNRLANLRWDTRKANRADDRRLGKPQRKRDEAGRFLPRPDADKMLAA